MLLLQPFIIALLLKVVAKKDVFKIYDSTQSIMFALACSGIWIGLFNTIQEVCKERPILKRDGKSETMDIYIVKIYSSGGCVLYADYHLDGIVSGAYETRT